MDFLNRTLGFPKVPLDAPDATTLKGVMFREYSGLQHGAAPQELVDLKEWFKKILPQQLSDR